MNGPERSLWKSVRQGLRQYMRLRRIENYVGDGDPDIYFHAKYPVTGWIELKAKKLPARCTTKVFSTGGLRASQVIRIQELVDDSVPVYILAKASSRLFLVSGLLAPEFNSFTEEELRDNALWYSLGGMKKSDWKELARVLKHSL